MLTGIRLIDYQSHRRTNVPLGLFTVFTGPSNSGKSSLIRAGSLAVQNDSGVDYIRRGARSCAVILTGVLPDGTSFAAGIERTAKGGGRYRLKIGDEEPREFTKLGGKVPGPVAEVLKLGKLNFAGQFDGPYLVGVTGSQIAITLAELTNVSMVFRAAAEAGRVRKGADRDLKGAEARLEALQAQQEQFAGLPAQQAAIGRAEQYAAQAEQFARDLARLQALIERAEADAGDVALARAAAFAPPDLSQLESCLVRYQRLCALIAAYDQAAADLAHWERQAEYAAEGEADAHKALHDALVSAGQCPTCGSTIAA